MIDVSVKFCNFGNLTQLSVFLDLNPIFILTQVDSLCAYTEEKTSNVFHSTVIRDKVQKSNYSNIISKRLKTSDQ